MSINEYSKVFVLKFIGELRVQARRNLKLNVWKLLTKYAQKRKQLKWQERAVVSQLLEFYNYSINSIHFRVVFFFYFFYKVNSYENEIMSTRLHININQILWKCCCFKLIILKLSILNVHMNLAGVWLAIKPIQNGLIGTHKSPLKPPYFIYLWVCNVLDTQDTVHSKQNSAVHKFSTLSHFHWNLF